MGKTHSILLTKYVLKILEIDTELAELISIERIYAVYAKLSSVMPYAIIERTGITPASSKDGIYEDTVSFRIGVVDDDYDTIIMIADKIRNTLESHGWHDEDFWIKEIKLNSAYEGFGVNCYTQTLEFTAKIGN